MYYNKKISKLKNANPKKWFYWLKKKISSDQVNEQQIIVDEISHVSKEEQTGKIADSFCAISQEYDEINPESIETPPFTPKDIPSIDVKTVENYLKEIKTCKATTRDDIPAIIFKKFSKLLCEPITELINACITTGTWTD